MTEILYRLFPIVVSVGLLAYIFVLLRSHRVRERYVWVWLILGVGMLVLSIVPQLAFTVSDWLGFEAPSNLLLVSCSVFLLIAVMNLSTAISALEEDRRRFVEEIALLDARIRELEDRISETETEAETEAETETEAEDKP
ncbi:MAG: DUF2304 domain-containing protein [Ancrocorticia sp.]